MNSNSNSPAGFWRRLWQRWVSPVNLRALARAGAKRVGAGWIPIRSLSPRHKPRILKHLRSLKPEDRYLRFGYPATDEQIERYVLSLKFERDEIFGVFNRRLELVAMAHLAFSVDPQWATCAEFGVSVASHQRGKGLGARLFKHAVMHARNQAEAGDFASALDVLETSLPQFETTGAPFWVWATRWDVTHQVIAPDGSAARAPARSSSTSLPSCPLRISSIAMRLVARSRSMEARS